MVSQLAMPMDYKGSRSVCVGDIEYAVFSSMLQLTWAPLLNGKLTP